jgi:general stress protein 26
MNDVAQDLTDFKKIVSDIKFAMLSTLQSDGSIHSRPMSTLNIEGFDGTLWFFSKKDSNKNHNIENDQHVNLAYSNPSKQTYVSVSGRATISDDRDRMKAFWNPGFTVWFPEGLEDPELSLIGVKVESAEIWDSEHKISDFIDFVKSTLTGMPVDIRPETKHINM